MKKYQKIILSIVTAFIAVFSICFNIFKPMSASAYVTSNANHGVARYFKFADYGTNLNDSYNGKYIWTFNGNIYYAYNQVFEDYAPRWVSVSNSEAPTGVVYRNFIWSNGVDTYYSNGTTHKKLTANTNSVVVTFTNTTFSGGISSFNGRDVWTDGTFYYVVGSSSNQFRLNQGSTSWTDIGSTSAYVSVNGSKTAINGYGVFNLLGNTYYFNGSNVYILKSVSDRLNGKNFEILSSHYRDPEYIWTDGYDLYYSNLNTQEIFNPTDGTWSSFDWTFGGIGRNYPFYGYDVFIYNDLIYTKYNNGSSNLLFVSSNLIYKKGYDLGKTDGYNAGYQAGYEAGTSGSTADSYNQGYQAGYQAGANANTGYQAGYDVGYEQGYNKGLLDNQSNIYNQGYNAGNSAGYGQGYNEGIEDGSDYSFFSLFGAVLDAPISALKGLLNFQIFGVNLLTLFTGLLTLAIILLVLKLMRGGK